MTVHRAMSVYCTVHTATVHRAPPLRGEGVLHGGTGRKTVHGRMP